MTAPHPRLGDLTPDELELLALEHVQIVFNELHATGAVAREKFHPLNLAKRHPVIAVGIAAAAAFLLFRSLRHKSAPANAQTPAPHAPDFFDSLLAGAASAAGRALPALLASWLTRQSKPD